MTILEFIYSKVHYLIDFRDSAFVCSGELCDFIKSDFGNLFINVLIVFVLADYSYRFFRKIHYLFR